MFKTITVLSYFWLSAALSSPVALLIMVLNLAGLGRPARFLMGTVSRAWARSVLWAVGARTTVSGLEHVPDDERICFVANHQGNLDIVMMLAYMPRPVGFIAKSEAALFPFLNIWIAALGSAFIDRKSPRRGKKAIDRGIRNIVRGHAIVIYPEGTRSRGPGMLPFRKGAFKLAFRSDATIVPVTIDGAWKVWEAHRRIESADVRIVVHPPVPVAALDAEQRKELPARVEAVIASALSGR